MVLPLLNLRHLLKNTMNTKASYGTLSHPHSHRIRFTMWPLKTPLDTARSLSQRAGNDVLLKR